jgi:phospho-N-acetylmuramoyl-pentapeptide-transferase
VRPILYAAVIGLFVTLAGTPIAIKVLRKRAFGQLLREDWSPSGHHAEKRGIPTGGGIVILIGIIAGYVAAHRPVSDIEFRPTGIIVLIAMAGMGLVGFADDYTKIRHQRSLGLSKTSKVIGQLAVAVVIALLAIHWADASTRLSFIRRTRLLFPEWAFVVWVFVMTAATTNGVNLTDGLDGLAAGSCALVFAAYVVISFWQFRHPCGPSAGSGCYAQIPDPIDLAVVAAAALGACAGFLWWNAAPAKIFMGDTGSLGLGGGLAALAILSSTQLLLVILGGLFVLETTSVIAQVVAFRGFRRRVFRMAPLHHHFELGGWPEFTVIVRFWIIAGLSAALGLGLFYADFLARGGTE